MISQDRAFDETKSQNKSSNASVSQPVSRAPPRILLRSNPKKRKGLRSGNFNGEIRVNEYFYQAYVNPLFLYDPLSKLEYENDWDERALPHPLSPCHDSGDSLHTVCCKATYPFSRTLGTCHSTLYGKRCHDCALSKSLSFRAYSPRLFDPFVSQAKTLFDVCPSKSFHEDNILSGNTDPHSTLSYSISRKDDSSLKSSLETSPVVLCTGDSLNDNDLKDDYDGYVSSVKVIYGESSNTVAANNVGDFKSRNQLSPIQKRQASSRPVRQLPTSRADTHKKDVFLTREPSDRGLAHPCKRAKLSNHTNYASSKNMESWSKLTGVNEFFSSRNAVSAYETLFCSLDSLSWDTELYRCVADDIAAIVKQRRNSGGSLTAQDCWSHTKLINYLIQKHSSGLCRSSVNPTEAFSRGVGTESVTPSVEMQLWERVTRCLNRQGSGMSQYKQKLNGWAREKALQDAAESQLMRDGLKWGLTHEELFEEVNKKNSRKNSLDTSKSSSISADTETEVKGSICVPSTGSNSFYLLCQKFKFYSSQVCRVGRWKNKVHELYCTLGYTENKPLLETAIDLLGEGLKLQSICDLEEELSVLKCDVEKCTSFQEHLMKEVPSIFENTKVQDFLVEPATLCRLKELVETCEKLPFAISGRINLTRCIKDALTWQMMAAAAVSSQDLDRCKDLLKEGGGTAVELSGVGELRSDVASGEWIECLRRLLNTRKPLSMSQLDYILSAESLAYIKTRFSTHSVVIEFNSRCESAARWLIHLYKPALQSLLTATDISELSRATNLFIRLFTLYHSSIWEETDQASDSYIAQFSLIAKTLHQKLLEAKTSLMEEPVKKKAKQLITLDESEVSTSLLNNVEIHSNQKNINDVLDVVGAVENDASTKAEDYINSKKTFPKETFLDFLNQVNYSTECLYPEYPNLEYKSGYCLLAANEIFELCDAYFSIRFVFSAFKTLDGFRQKIKRWRKRQLCAVSGRSTVSEQDVVSIVKEGCQLCYHVDLHHEVQELILVLHNYRLWRHRVDEILKNISSFLSQGDISKASNRLLFNTCVYKPIDINCTDEQSENNTLDPSSLTSVEQLVLLDLDRPSMDDITSLLVQNSECPIVDLERSNRLKHIRETAERWKRRARELIKLPLTSRDVARAHIQLLVEACYLAVHDPLEKQLKVLFFLQLWRQQVNYLKAPIEEQQVLDLAHLPYERQFRDFLSDTESIETHRKAQETSFQYPLNIYFLASPEGYTVQLLYPLNSCVDLQRICQDTYDLLARQYSEQDFFLVLKFMVKQWNQYVEEWCSCTCRFHERPKLLEWTQLLVLLQVQPVRLISAQNRVQYALNRASLLSEKLRQLPEELNFRQLEEIQQEIFQCPIYLPEWASYEKLLRDTAMLRSNLKSQLEASIPVENAEDYLSELLTNALYTCQSFEIPFDLKTLPEYIDLQERYHAVGFWKKKYEHLDNSCWTLEEWESFFEEGTSLRLTSDSLCLLKNNIVLSTLWMKFYQALVLPEVSDKNSCQSQCDSESNRKLPLIFAEFLTQVNVGLENRLVFFKQLRVDVEAFLALKEESEKLMRDSQYQFELKYFSLACQTDRDKQEFGGNFIGTERAFSNTSSLQVVLDIFNLTFNLEKVLENLNSIASIDCLCLKRRITHEIKKRQLCVKLIVCLWSSVNLWEETMRIPYDAAVQVLEELKSWKLETFEAYETPNLLNRLRNFYLDVTDMPDLTPEAYDCFKKCLDNTKENFLTLKTDASTNNSAEILNLAYALSQDIEGLMQLLAERLCKTREWMSSFISLIQNTSLKNLCCNTSGETVTNSNFVWPTTLEGYHSFLILVFKQVDFDTLVGVDHLQNLLTLTSKHTLRSKNFSGFLAARKISHHTRITDLFDGLSIQCSFVTVGQILHENLIKYLNEFRKTFGIQGFKMVKQDIISVKTKPWAYLMTPKLMLHDSTCKLAFPEQWNSRFPEFNFFSRKHEDSSSWRALGDQAFPTLEDALDCLKAAEANVSFQLYYYDVLHLTVGIFLVILFILEYQFFELPKAVNSFLASNFVQPIPRYDTVSVALTPSPCSPQEAIELIELLDLSVFQSEYKHFFATYLYEMLTFRLNQLSLFLFLPVITSKQLAYGDHTLDGDTRHWLLKDFPKLFHHSNPSACLNFEPTTFVTFQPPFTDLFIPGQIQLNAKDSHTMQYIRAKYLLNVNLENHQISTRCSLCGMCDAMMDPAMRGSWIPCVQCHRWFHDSCVKLPVSCFGSMRFSLNELGVYKCSLCLIHNEASETSFQCNLAQEVSLLLNSRWFFLLTHDSQDVQHEQRVTLNGECLRNPVSPPSISQRFPNLSTLLPFLYSINNTLIPHEEIPHYLRESYYRLIVWCFDVCVTLLKLLNATSDLLVSQRQIQDVPIFSHEFHIKSNTSRRGFFSVESPRHSGRQETLLRPATRSKAVQHPSQSSPQAQITCMRLNMLKTENSLNITTLPKDKTRKSVLKGKRSVKASRVYLKSATWKKALEEFQKIRPFAFTSYATENSSTKSTNLHSTRQRISLSDRPFHKQFFLDLNSFQELSKWFLRDVTLENLEDVCKSFVNLCLRHQHQENDVTLETFLSFYTESESIKFSLQHSPNIEEMFIVWNFHFQEVDIKNLWVLNRFVLEGIFLGVDNVPLFNFLVILLKRYSQLNDHMELFLNAYKNSKNPLALLNQNTDDLKPFIHQIQNFHPRDLQIFQDELVNHQPLFILPAYLSCIHHFQFLCQLSYDVLSLLCSVAPLKELELQGLKPIPVHGVSLEKTSPFHTYSESELKNLLVQARLPHDLLRLMETYYLLQRTKDKAIELLSLMRIEIDLENSIPQLASEAQIMKTDHHNSNMGHDDHHDDHHDDGDVHHHDDHVKKKGKMEENKQEKEMETTEEELINITEQFILAWKNWIDFWKCFLNTCACSVQSHHIETFCSSVSDRKGLLEDAKEIFEGHRDRALVCPRKFTGGCTPSLECQFSKFLFAFQDIVESKRHLLKQANAVYVALVTPVSEALPEKEREVLNKLCPRPFGNKIFSLAALRHIIQNLQTSRLQYKHMDTLVSFYTSQKNLLFQLNNVKRRIRKRDKQLLTQEEYTGWIRTLEGTLCCWGEPAMWLMSCREEIEKWIEKTRMLIKEFSSTPKASYQNTLVSLSYATSLKKELSTLAVNLSKTHLVGDLRRIIRELRPRKQNATYTIINKSPNSDVSQKSPTPLALSNVKKYISSNGSDASTQCGKQEFNVAVAAHVNPKICSSSTLESKTLNNTLPNVQIIPGSNVPMPQPLFVQQMYGASPLQNPGISETASSSLSLQQHSPFPSLFAHPLSSTFNLNNAATATNFYSGNPSTSRLFDFNYSSMPMTPNKKSLSQDSIKNSF